MPDIPTALPDKMKIRALIRERGYSVTDVARKIGRPPATLHAITGRKPKPTGVTLLRQIAAALSTPRRPVRVGDISDWTGDDDIEPEALASLDELKPPPLYTTGAERGLHAHSNKTTEGTTRK